MAPPRGGTSSRRIQTLQSALSRDSDDLTVTFEGSAERVSAQQELSYEGYFPSLCTSQTQTSLTSSSDDSVVRGGGAAARVKSVAVGPSGVNRKTQTPAPRGERERERPAKGRR